jgi:hypothetical protein
MSTTSEQDVADEHGRPTRIAVIVNDDRVILSEHRLTGLEIKKAAIEQGTALQLGFQLSVKRGDHYKVIADNETITVHEHDEFVAVAGDDNS